MGNCSFSDFIDELEKHFNQVEPQIMAFLPEEARFERLRSEGESLLKRYPNPEMRPPLFGMMIGVKDIFHVDGFKTRAGSQVPPERLAGPEAECVSALKKAGALTFGKTVTTEFAYFAPGPTRNPHNLAYTPGGSSSGSAAAVSAGIVPLALGTQTIGSIIRPASFCGVIGFKPTYERISRSGVIPLSPSMDHVGFFSVDFEMARKTAAILFKDWLNPEKSVEKPRLGVPDGPYLQKAGSEMLDHFENVCEHLEQAGYYLKRIPVMADFDEIASLHNLIVAVEAAQTHEIWYSEFGDTYHPKTVELIERGRKADPDVYQKALKSRKKLRDELTHLMRTEGIDLWLSPPALGPAPFDLDSTGDPIMNLPWTHCGFPTLNIPAGTNKAGLPMGLQVTAGWGKDEALLIWGKDMQETL